MLRTIFITLIVLFMTTSKAEASTSAFFLSTADEGLSFQIAREDSLLSLETDKKIIFKKKITAISLAIALGPLGMHRLYLGTDYRVPVIYAITLGAFGILPLIDIVAIITSKDFSRFENNNKIMMWIE